MYDDLKKTIGKHIYEQTLETRKKGDGWYVAARFLEDCILPSHEWADDPNIISALETAIRDLRAGIRQEKTSPDVRWSVVEEMNSVVERMVQYLRDNGLGMLEVCK